MLRTPLAAAALVAAGAIALPQIAPAQTAHGAASKAKLQLRTGAKGSYVVDSAGRTLYMFAKDTSKKSACSGACATAWPPYVTTGKPTAGKGVSAAKVGTIKRKDGRTQVTYGGHPLYRYLEDTKAGQTNGQGSNGFGAKWWVLAASGKPRTSSLSPSPTTTDPTTTSPGGYY